MTPAFTSFETLDVAVARLVAHGRREFPTRVDYEEAAAELGLNASQAWDNPAFAAAAMRHWHTTGQTGCLFARRLAELASHDLWQSAVFPGTGADALQGAAEGADDLLRQAVQSSECEIVSLLFPDVTTIADLRDVCELLARNTEITVTEDRSHPGLVTVAMRLDITGNGTLAWIMAFGPFGEWPATRRGPLLEFTIRVKPKPKHLFHKLNQDPAAAHLADTDPLLPNEQMEKVFIRTERTTRNVLGADPDHRSAARTTFSFPIRDWDAAQR